MTFIALFMSLFFTAVLATSSDDNSIGTTVLISLNISRIMTDQLIKLLLALSFLSSSILLAFPRWERFQVNITRHWNKSAMLRVLLEFQILVSLMVTLVFSLMVNSSIQLFLLTIFQYYPLFFVFIALSGVIIVLTALIGVSLAWIPSLYLVTNGMILDGIFLGLLYLYLVLALFNYYHSIRLLTKLDPEFMSSFSGDYVTDVSLKSIETDLKHREIDIIIRLATDQGWAVWNNYPWLKLSRKDVQRRVLEKCPVDYGEFLFFHRGILYLPALASRGVLNLETLSRRLQLDVGQLKGVLGHHWGADALFLSSTLVIHRNQLMLAEYFSVDELKSLNVEDVNIKALRAVVSSLEYYGFKEKARELKTIGEDIFVSSSSATTSEVGFRGDLPLESESNHQKVIRDDFNLLLDEGRMIDALKVSLRMGDDEKVQHVLTRVKESRDMIIAVGDVFLNEERVDQAFEWFCQHGYWDYALDVSDALLRNELRLFFETKDVEHLLGTVRRIFQVILESNLIDHGMLKEIALVLFYLDLQKEEMLQSMGEERIAFHLIDIYQVSPYLFPVEQILDPAWHLLSEAGNHSKAAEILQLLANKSRGQQKQMYYDLLEKEVNKENGEYLCIKDLKMHQMDGDPREICSFCKTSTCFHCIYEEKESNAGEVEIKCARCNNMLGIEGRKRERNVQVGGLPLDPEGLVQYVSSFFLDRLE